jgi:hypothetical protein
MSVFPFYVVSALYSHEPSYQFLFTIDYINDTAVLNVYPFNKEMAKLPQTNITLTDILPRKVISTMHIKSMTYKINPNTILITQAVFIVGYRSGHLLTI